MAIELTPEEKIGIIEQHLKNVLYSEYNAQLSLIEANALSEPIQTNIDAINLQLKDIAAQKDILQKEINSLTPANPATPASN
jgi:hypothetical protein